MTELDIDAIIKDIKETAELLVGDIDAEMGFRLSSLFPERIEKALMTYYLAAYATYLLKEHKMKKPVKKKRENNVVPLRRVK